jgi:RNA polymerase primary sigma factor
MPYLRHGGPARGSHPDEVEFDTGAASADELAARRQLLGNPPHRRGTDLTRAPCRRAGATAERERDLVLAAKHGNDTEREALVRAFTPLIAGTARIYRTRSTIDREELMQEGVVGLLRALDRFEPARGIPFWPYASWWVRQAMQQLVRELGGTIVLSDRALRKLARIREARRVLLQRDCREPDPAGLARESGLARDEVERLIAATRHPRGLEEPVGPDADTSLAELLADPRAVEAFECIPRRIELEQLPRLLAVLSERERTIIAARFGLDGFEHTLRELGDGLGVSAERVRQIENVSLDKLRDAVRSGRYGHEHPDPDRSSPRPTGTQRPRVAHGASVGEG